MSLFTNSQLKRFSNIFDNAGQVLFGSTVITPVINPTPYSGILFVSLFGGLLTILLWWISLRLERISL